MSIEEVELNVGGTSFKGVWIAVLLSFASTLGGGIWATSEFFSRLEALEETVEESLSRSATVNTRFDDFREVWQEDKKSLTSDLAVVQQQMEDANIDELQGKLAELGTNLQQILSRQQELLSIQDRIVAVEAKIIEVQTTVQSAEQLVSSAEDMKTLSERLDKINREIDDIWEGMDYLSNPYGG